MRRRRTAILKCSSAIWARSASSLGAMRRADPSRRNWQRSMAPPSRKTSAIRFFTGMPRHSLPGRGIMKSQRVESQQTQQQWSVPLPRWCSVLAHRGGGRSPRPTARPDEADYKHSRYGRKTALIKPSFPRTREIHLLCVMRPGSPGGGQAPALRQDLKKRSTSTRAMVEELRSLTRHSRIRGNPSSLCNAIQQPVEGQAPALRGVDIARSSANQNTLAESNCLVQEPLVEV